MDANLPFSGFYNSIYSSGIDSAEELDIEHLAEEHDLPEEEIGELLFKHADYHAAYLSVAKAYVEHFNEWLNEKYALNVSLTFKLMTSPREYNFMTDRIFVDISAADVEQVYLAVGEEAVPTAAKELFTSRSGFISYYRPDIDSWGGLHEWDHNQLLAIFEAAVADEEDFDLHMYYALDETFYEAWCECVDWEGFNKAVELLKEGEEPDDGRTYPKHCNAQSYVKQFISLNHLKGE